MCCGKPCAEGIPSSQGLRRVITVFLGVVPWRKSHVAAPKVLGAHSHSREEVCMPDYIWKGVVGGAIGATLIIYVVTWLFRRIPVGPSARNLLSMDHIRELCPKNLEPERPNCYHVYLDETHSLHCEEGIRDMPLRSVTGVVMLERKHLKSGRVMSGALCALHSTNGWYLDEDYRLGGAIVLAGPQVRLHGDYQIYRVITRPNFGSLYYLPAHRRCQVLDAQTGNCLGELRVNKFGGAVLQNAAVTEEKSALQPA